MRLLALTLGLILSTTVFAKTSMKITGEMQYQFRAKDVPPPTVGLGLYQSLGKRFAYNTWTGLGHQARLSDPTVRWFATKHELIYYAAPRVDLSLGYVYKNANQDKSGGPLDIAEHAASVKVSLKIL